MNVFDKALPLPMQGMIMEIIESMDGVEWLRKEMQASHSPFLRTQERRVYFEGLGL